MNFQEPTPLPMNTKVLRKERGGDALNLSVPDRFSDYAVNDNEKELSISWMNNRNGKWSKPWVINLGKLTYPGIAFYRHGLGIFNLRQYRIVTSAKCSFKLVEIDSEVEILV